MLAAEVSAFSNSSSRTPGDRSFTTIETTGTHRQPCVLSRCSTSPAASAICGASETDRAQSFFSVATTERLGEEFRRGRETPRRGHVMNEINRSPAFWRSFPIFEEFDKETIDGSRRYRDLPKMAGRHGDLPARRRRQLHDRRHIRAHQAVADHAAGPRTDAAPASKPARSSARWRCSTVRPRSADATAHDRAPKAM